MATTVFDPLLRQSRKPPQDRRVARRRPPRPRPLIGQLAITVAIVGLLLVVASVIGVTSRKELALPGGAMTFVGSMTGFVGMYLALIMVLIVARIPMLERILGQDGMLRWHRTLSPWPLSLIALHVLFVTIGYGQASKQGPAHEFVTLMSSYPDILAATVGFCLMAVIGIVSIRALRDRLRRETWWVLHLYMYLALVLSFAHVLALGPSFVGHPLTRALWSVAWGATVMTVLAYRVALPLLRSFRHRLRVLEVIEEAPGVTSVIMTGRQLERLPISGGQFAAWRFLTGGLWWQAHPYSLSALPRPPYLRITVKQIGDHSRAVARLKPGTRVALEGPYGAVTPYVRRHLKVALIAGGIGITALRSLLEDLPKETRPIVIMRGTSEEQLVFATEVAELARHRKGTVHHLVGARRQVGELKSALRKLIPDIRQRDLYVCGPPGMVEDVVAAAHDIGVSRDSIHYEIYSW